MPFARLSIRHAAIDIILKLRRRWEREVSLDYLMIEKFVQLAEPEQLEEYLFTVCGRPPFCTMRNLPPPLPVCRSRHRKNFPLLLPAPAAASDRRTYRTDTQHSARRHIQLALKRLRRLMERLCKLLPYETIVKAHEATGRGKRRSFHYAGYIRYFSKSTRAGQRRG